MAMNIEQVCDTCKRGGDATVATTWCNNCEEALCDTCLVFHKRIKSTSTHTVVKIQQLPRVLDTCYSCTEHAGNPLQHFCLDHQRICCEVCLYQFHGDCPNVCSIDDVSDLKSSKGNGIKLLELLEEIETISDKMNNDYVNADENLDSKYLQVLNTMSDMIDEAKVKVDGFFVNIETKLKLEQRKQTTNVLEQSKTLQKFANSLNQYQNFIKRGLNQEPKIKNEEFLAAQNMKSKLKTEVNQMIIDLQNYPVCDFDLRVDDLDDKLEATLQESIEIKMTARQQSDYIDQITNSAATFSSSQQIHNKNIVKCPDVSVLDDLDDVAAHSRKIAEIRINGSRFYRGIFLNDQRILIPDYNYEKLKVYDTAGNLKFDYPLLRKPWDIACNPSGRIFVSFPNSLCFKKYTLSGTTFTERQTLDTFNSGISGFDDVLGDYIFHAAEHKINILRPNGNSLRDIDVSWRIPCIAASVSEPKFYFTDDNDIICQDIEGTELTRFSNLDLSSTIALSVDTVGGLYVSNFHDQILSVRKIYDTGKSKVIANVTCSDESPPRGVTFDTKGRRFMVVSHIETPGNLTRTIRSAELQSFPYQMMEVGVGEIYQVLENNVETEI